MKFEFINQKKKKKKKKEQAPLVYMGQYYKKKPIWL